MARYLSKWASVEAIQFDGTRASALAIAKAFPGRIARDVERDDAFVALVESYGRDELRVVRIGDWVVKPSCTSPALTIVSDGFFQRYHERL